MPIEADDFSVMPVTELVLGPWEKCSARRWARHWSGSGELAAEATNRGWWVEDQICGYAKGKAAGVEDAKRRADEFIHKHILRTVIVRLENAQGVSMSTTHPSLNEMLTELMHLD